jgi:hypothetical protein
MARCREPLKILDSTAATAPPSLALCCGEAPDESSGPVFGKYCVFHLQSFRLRSMAMYNDIS